MAFHIELFPRTLRTARRRAPNPWRGLLIAVLLAIGASEVPAASDLFRQTDQITINGVFKGDCPIDVLVHEGMVEVMATKPLDDVYDKVFLTSFRLGADATRRVEVQIADHIQFSARAMARADAAIEAESTRKEAQQLQALPELERAAQGGAGGAMTRLGLIHERGLAGPVNFTKAIAWYARAAQAC